MGAVGTGGEVANYRREELGVGGWMGGVLG